MRGLILILLFPRPRGTCQTIPLSKGIENDSRGVQPSFNRVLVRGKNCAEEFEEQHGVRTRNREIIDTRTVLFSTMHPESSRLSGRFQNELLWRRTRFEERSARLPELIIKGRRRGKEKNRVETERRREVQNLELRPLEFYEGTKQRVCNILW